jgi:hypothetical protein
LSKYSIDIGKELYNLNGNGPVSVLMGDFWPASIVCSDGRERTEERDGRERRGDREK